MLKELYEDVEADVDYYVGGLLERRRAPLFGPTFQALLEDRSGAGDSLIGSSSTSSVSRIRYLKVRLTAVVF